METLPPTPEEGKSDVAKSSATRKKQFLIRVSNSWSAAKGIPPHVKILWQVIAGCGDNPVISQRYLMDAIDVSNWHTLRKYLNRIKELVPGWGWIQQKSAGKWKTNRYQSLPQPIADFSHFALADFCLPADSGKSTINKVKGTIKEKTPEIAALLLSIPIDGIPTTGYPLEAETKRLLVRVTRDIQDAGVSVQRLMILRAFYARATDPLGNEWSRVHTFPDLLRKWATELKRAETWRLQEDEKQKRRQPDNVVDMDSR